MDELLQKLVESELLTEDTKTELKDAFTQKLKEREDSLREEVETEVKASLAEKYAKDKEALIDAIDTKLDERIDDEIAELKEDIERFRDLEAEYADKLVEERQKMAETVKEDMTTVLESLDAYVEMILASEVEELRESIEDVRKEEHGRRVLEVIGEEYRRLFTEEGDLEQELSSLREERERMQNELREAREQVQGIERDRKMDEVLESLSGRSREVMEAILQNVATDKLEEAYNRYVGRVLHESATTSETNSEKDEEVLAEHKNEESTTEGDDLKVMSGDKEKVMEDYSDDSEPEKKLDEGTLQELRKLSGLTS